MSQIEVSQLRKTATVLNGRLPCTAKEAVVSWSPASQV